jgi:hypothetical protein
MKNLVLTLAIVACGSLLAQQPVSADQYDQLKRAGQLDASTHYIFVSPDRQVQTSAPARYSGPQQTQSATCNCLIPLDTTFSVVPFFGCYPPNYRNDDSYSNLMTLPFSFNFFGAMRDSIYINNNGNISFYYPYNTFTPDSFPSVSFNMIAPFWADIDTRDTGSGLVYYKLTPTHLIVKWEQVGYFAGHSDKLNTFQLIITNGLDTILPAGQNVSFCYGDMQWTTGDASNGMGGFGGTASTVGVNQGNGVDYFQVTRNDTAGATFDGPYNTNDGIDWLDDQEIYFNTALLGNIPPLVMNSTICDTIDVFTGDTIRSIDIDSIAFEYFFMTPEVGQTVTASFSTNAPATAFSYTLIDNTPTYKKYSCIFRAKDLSPGMYTVTASATDDGAPAASSSSTIYIHTHYDAALGITDPSAAAQVSVFPNPASSEITVNTTTASSLSITNLMGQVIFTAPCNSNQTVVDVSNFAVGMYVVSVIQTDGSRTQTRLIRR